MRIVLQKVSQASVSVAGNKIGSIGTGFVLLVGIKQGDTQADADYLARKISKVRIFEDQEDKLNLDLTAVSGEILSISQFTLYAVTKKGNRPSFTEAALSEEAKALYDYFNEQLVAQGQTVVTGSFGEHMEVSLINDGPVTIIYDTENK